ncbi:hypothetical protein LXA43DRAFT_1091503 [Ganoderma leucocontextum]|nr:hypothetical protein LXA43DRAFT_1091503 [Ganoderma leucocontextum]
MLALANIIRVSQFHLVPPSPLIQVSGRPTRSLMSILVTPSSPLLRSYHQLRRPRASSARQVEEEYGRIDDQRRGGHGEGNHDDHGHKAMSAAMATEGTIARTRKSQLHEVLGILSPSQTYNILDENSAILNKVFFLVHQDHHACRDPPPDLNITWAYVNSDELARATQVEASLKWLDTPYIDTMCMPHDLLQSEKCATSSPLLAPPEELDMIACTNHRGIDMPRSKRIADTFFDKPRRKADKKIMRRVEELAKKKQWKLSQVALSCVAAKISSASTGTRYERIAECEGENVLRVHSNMVVPEDYLRDVSGETPECLMVAIIQHEYDVVLQKV